jgi:hypothetical protein
MARRRSGTLRGAVAAGTATALVGTALLAGGPSPASAAKKKAAATPAAFCPTPGTNYRAPLETLQTIPALPEGGVLPFGPRGMTIAATGPQGVLVGGSKIGFRLTNTAAPTAAAPKKLHWTVLERLVRLTKNGHDLHPEGLQRIDLGQLPTGKHRGLTFPIATKPAVYSLEVTIQNGRGRRLGRYGEYVRVVERTLDIGMTLTAYDKIAPGSYLESCFENHGSASMTVTGGYLERLDGLIWKVVPIGPQYTPAQTTSGLLLGPGASEPRYTYVPPNALPGLYKVILSATTELGEAVTTSAEFGVG